MLFVRITVGPLGDADIDGVLTLKGMMAGLVAKMLQTDPRLSLINKCGQEKEGSQTSVRMRG